METKQCYLLAIGFNMTVIWGYLKFCRFMSDFDKCECYNLPHVTTCPGLPYSKTIQLDAFNFELQLKRSLGISLALKRFFSVLTALELRCFTF